MASRWRVLAVGAWFAVACGGDPEGDPDPTTSGDDDDDDDDDDGDDDDAPADDGPEGDSSHGPSSHDDSGTSASDTGGSDSESSTGTTESGTDSGTGMESESSTGEPVDDCDPFAQDCPAGQKCSAWADDGGGTWNATKCVPIADDPAQPGEPCSVKGSGASGIDSCDIGSMCWDVDGSLMGTCVSLCSGSIDMPVCDDDASACGIYNGGVLNLCLPICNPLADDCPDGQGCYIRGSFVCSPDGSGAAGQQGDECMFVNACDPGLVCMDGDYVAGCTDPACCTAACDISDPTACTELEMLCIPAFDEGTAPPGLELVGFCLDV